MNWGNSTIFFHDAFHEMRLHSLNQYIDIYVKLILVIMFQKSIFQFWFKIGLLFIKYYDSQVKLFLISKHIKIFIFKIIVTHLWKWWLTNLHKTPFCSYMTSDWFVKWGNICFDQSAGSIHGGVNLLDFITCKSKDK